MNEPCHLHRHLTCNSLDKGTLRQISVLEGESVACFKETNCFLEKQVFLRLHFLLVTWERLDAERIWFSPCFLRLPLDAQPAVPGPWRNAAVTRLTQCKQNAENLGQKSLRGTLCYAQAVSSCESLLKQNRRVYPNSWFLWWRLPCPSWTALVCWEGLLGKSPWISSNMRSMGNSRYSIPSSGKGLSFQAFQCWIGNKLHSKQTAFPCKRINPVCLKSLETISRIALG